MDIKHFAISAIDGETPGHFLKRVGNEVLELEESGKKIQNIVVNFLSDIDPTERLQAVVFYRSDEESNEHSMKYKEFKSDAHSSSIASLKQNIKQMDAWLERAEGVEIYDVSMQAALDSEGLNLNQTIIYYDNKA